MIFKCSIGVFSFKAFDIPFTKFFNNLISYVKTNTKYLREVNLEKMALM